MHQQQAAFEQKMWEKKKLLITTSNFFFSCNFFYSIRKLYPHLSIFLTSYLSLEESKIGMWSSVNNLSKFYPFPRRQILDSSKLKELADNNSRFDENGEKFSNSLEKTVGKGKKKLLRMSDFSFTNNVLKWFVLNTCETCVCFEKG